jgi:hypothetical protein
MFIIALTIVAIRGQEIDCGCFSLKSSDLNKENPISLIIRDLAMLIAIVFVFVHEVFRMKKPSG